MTAWEVVITATSIAYGIALTALGTVVGLHLRDVARDRRRQGTR